MTKSRLLVLAPLLAACSSVPEGAGGVAPTDPSVSGQGSDQAKQYPLSERELAVWNDPAFQKRFIQSYIAETDTEPSMTMVEREEMQEILQLISSDEVDVAVARLEEQREASGNAVFDYTLAGIHTQNDEFEMAAALYKLAVEKHDSFQRAWKNLGLTYFRMGDFTQAVPALTRVIELGGGDETTYGLLGFCYSNLENPIAAESAYRMAALLGPETPDWKYGLARSFFQQQRYAEAAALCGSLISEEPDRADLWMMQGLAYMGLNDTLRAAENLEMVDQLGGSTAESLNNLGDIYANEQLFDLAVNSYIRAMETDSGTDAKRPMLAAKFMSANGALEATRTLVEAIQSTYDELLDDDQKKDLLRIQVSLAIAGEDLDEQVRVLEGIVAIDPLDGQALIRLGNHARTSGDTEQAIFYYERAANIEEFEADAKVSHAQLLVGQRRYAEALPLLRRAQVVDPRDSIQDYLEQVERAAQNR